MKVEWKLFKKTFPQICTKCNTLSNMPREYCESCGEKDSFRPTTKEDFARSKEQ